MPKNKPTPTCFLKMTTIQKGDTVLVTGVTSFIGSRVAEVLLASGYKIRGTTRTAATAKWLVDNLNRKFGSDNFSIVEVPDMIHAGAYDAAVVGVSGIVHLASVMTYGTDPEEVVGPTVKGVLNIFESAAKAPGVKSFVYTSSSAACVLPEADKLVIISKDTYNLSALEAAYEPNPTAFQVYAASKTAAERALWDAVEMTAPSFQVAAVLPDANFGRLLKPTGNSMGDFITGLYNGNDYAFNIPPQWFVDVVDNAKLHVAALIDPACNGQRIFAWAEPYNWNDVLAIFRKLEPGRSFMEDRPLGRSMREVPNAEAEALLWKHFGHGWTSLEQSITQNIAPIAA